VYRPHKSLRVSLDISIREDVEDIGERWISKIDSGKPSLVPFFAAIYHFDVACIGHPRLDRSTFFH